MVENYENEMSFNVLTSIHHISSEKRTLYFAFTLLNLFIQKNLSQILLTLNVWILLRTGQRV